MSALDVVDPATGAVFASAPACTTAELDAAVAAAAAAAPGWAALPLD
ncbi:aldehyde dehydrogenase family protein, partial [Micromonospora carbonacea]